jgi:tetraacyldisaccharide 4'-kinase
MAGMSRSGPLPEWTLPVAWPASLAYGAASAAIGRWRASRAVDVGVPVISVGNVSVGGTGKSPMVRWVCARLLEAGHEPVVALRGYRAVGGLSDEAEEHRVELPGVRVAVGGDRAASIAGARAMHPSIDVAVLDDGFQHRQVRRALDIVLIDAARPAIDGACLPAGWLREPASTLRRADLVIVTRATAMDGRIGELVRRARGREPDAWARHVWRSVDRCGADGVVVRDAPVLREPVVAACALARPEAFFADVVSCGGTLEASLAFPDHHAFGTADLTRIASTAGGRPVVVTGKDWVKIAPLLGTAPEVVQRLDWRVVRVGIEFLSGGEAVARAVRDAAAVDGSGTDCRSMAP